MAKIDSAYAYYASTYANKEVSRYDSHKKSDLRKIYNRIIKTNKESPLYKISNMQAPLTPSRRRLRSHLMRML